jgi:hypothetical protein
MATTATIPTAYVLTTAKWIKKLAYLIALIGTVASYGTQVDLLLENKVGGFSWVIPGTVDLLAICAALALQLPGLDSTSRRIAGAVLTVAVVVSVLANVSGAHNRIAALAHAWPVVAYLFGELIANRVRSYAARLVAAEAAVNAPVIAPVVSAPAVTRPVTAPVIPMHAVNAPVMSAMPLGPCPAPIMRPVATAPTFAPRVSAALTPVTSTVSAPVIKPAQVKVPATGTEAEQIAQVADMLAKNPDLTGPQVAEALGLQERTARRRLAGAKLAEAPAA